jgi:predicted ATPase/DNA-binding winged helix-turn-helix (wHTH) protein
VIDLPHVQPRSYRFGPFVLVPERQQLLLDGVPVRIGGRALDILTALVEHAGEVVGKRALMARVWPDVVVDEGNLKVNMAALRRALGDGSVTTAGAYVATVIGRGYRFVAPVESMGVSALEPHAPAAPRPGHNLPIGTTRIFGRTDVIESLSAELDTGRLVSIVGPGGIGKTTVALAVAERSLDKFPDGVWLIDLATLTDPELVPNAIAAAIGVGVTSADMLASTCDFLRARRMLLLLDSCEHVIDAAAGCVERILARAAGVRVLATSREPLMVNRERVRRLLGLTSPPEGATVGAEDALRYPAIQLFVERACERLDSYSLSDADAPVVADICRRLDGMALAIELAATRVDVFGVAGLLSQLNDRFSVLTGRRAGPERHRTLAATIEWSFGLLSPGEAAFLQAMAVFSGPFDAEGALAVSATTRSDALASLAQLADKSLVATDIDGDRIAYRLMDTTRSHCLERLLASGEVGRARQRHAEHICAVLERATEEWARQPPSEWGAVYGRVIDDLRSALDWTSRDETNRALRIRLTLAGILLWNHFSLTAECRLHVSKAVQELEATGLSGTEFEMKLKLWLGGSSMFTEGLKPLAMETLQRALAIAIRIGNTDYRLRCLIMIGIYELFTGEHEAGIRTVEAFATLASSEDPLVLPEGEVHFGIGELFLGQLQNARHRLETLQRRDIRDGVRYLSDPKVMVGTVLTQVQWLTGSPDTAMRTAVDTVALAERTKHHLSLNNILSYACPVYLWSGDFVECDRMVGLLEEHVMRHGIVARRPLALFYRAALDRVREGASAAVIDRLKEAIEDFRRTNHFARMPYYLGVLADAQRAAGDLGEADATIRQALDIARQQNEGWILPEVLRVQAAVLLDQGHPQEAEQRLLKSMTKAQMVNALSWRLRAAVDLATLWRSSPKEKSARPMLQAVFDQFTEGFATQDLSAAARMLETRTASSLP